MAKHSPTLDEILRIQRVLDKNDIPSPFRGACPEPTVSTADYQPDQEEMDNLASVLTEAVLQLRAGDIAGARATLNSADHLCDIRISAVPIRITDKYMAAADKYLGVDGRIGTARYNPPDRVMTATEQLLRQQHAEQKLRRIMEDANSMLYPPRIVSDDSK